MGLITCRVSVPNRPSRQSSCPTTSLEQRGQITCRVSLASQPSAGRSRFLRKSQAQNPNPDPQTLRQGRSEPQLPAARGGLSRPQSHPLAQRGHNLAFINGRPENKSPFRALVCTLMDREASIYGSRQDESLWFRQQPFRLPPPPPRVICDALFFFVSIRFHALLAFPWLSAHY